MNTHSFKIGEEGIYATDGRGKPAHTGGAQRADSRCCGPGVCPQGTGGGAHGPLLRPRTEITCSPFFVVFSAKRGVLGRGGGNDPLSNSFAAFVSVCALFSRR